jgi:DNA-directed RNA polymerase specialized sigma24 family protein
VQPSVMDSVTQAVAKFFYFTSLDEQISFAASLKALAELRQNGWLEEKFRPRWIGVLSKWKPRIRQLRGRQWPGFAQAPGFVRPPDFDLNAWSGFLNSGETSEVEAVLFSKMLNFSDEEIADGLGVTIGTVRYRVGRGLRHLGGYLES